MKKNPDTGFQAIFLDSCFPNHKLTPRSISWDAYFMAMPSAAFVSFPHRGSQWEKHYFEKKHLNQASSEQIFPFLLLVSYV